MGGMRIREKEHGRQRKKPKVRKEPKSETRKSKYSTKGAKKNIQEAMHYLKTLLSKQNLHPYSLPT